MKENMPYEYQNRPRELVSSNGFSVEYDPRVTNQELRDDIISYLGEYRFQVPKFEYELAFSDGKLRDPHRNEAMEVKAQRSVKERMMRGENIDRETAEAIGLRFLDKQLDSAEVGNSIVWASPPGSKEEGYGDYGFFYVGRIKRNIENKKEIQMAALRLENPTLEKYNKAFYALTNIDYEAKVPEDYLKFPVVVEERLDEDFVMSVLNKNFSIDLNPEQKQIFDLAMERLLPKIDEYILTMRGKSIVDKKKAFHALENYSLQIKREFEEGKITIFETNQGFEKFVKVYGYEPPKVAGSCPIKSSGLNSLSSNSINSFMESEGFTCPKCSKKADGPVGNKCPNCGITKEEWAKSNKVC